VLRNIKIDTLIGSFLYPDERRVRRRKAAFIIEAQDYFIPNKRTKSKRQYLNVIYSTNLIFIHEIDESESYVVM